MRGEDKTKRIVDVYTGEDDTICQENIASVIEFLNEERIKIGSKAVGGTERRTISLDVKNGTIHYTEGYSKEKLLWKSLSIELEGKP